ncbi:hypothetical protein O3M35_003230 [Rhynocoris fuscipes]|uniref:Uncharacterized protein n=1 Tax=Rhynocoris fuscipes TaxID=488301 RepID=A0AAW1CMA2_9HEMI
MGNSGSSLNSANNGRHSRSRRRARSVPTSPEIRDIRSELASSFRPSSLDYFKVIIAGRVNSCLSADDGQ